jgi:anthranilate synthase component 1
MTAITPSLAEFRKLVEKANVISLSLELVADVETPVSAFNKLERAGHSFLFESTEKNEISGRFSFLGVEPRVIFQSKGREISITHGKSTRKFQTSRDPLSELRQLMSEYRFAARPDLPRFAGGAVGFIGYDVVRFFEPTVPAAARDDVDLAEMIFMVTGALLIFDHRLRTLKIVANAFLDPGSDPDKIYAETENEIQHIVEQLKKPTSLPTISAAPLASIGEPRSNMSREQFEAIVAKAQEHIRAGDVFQVVLSQRFETEFQASPLDLYRALRFVNPSPYMFCLKFGDEFSLVGSSPEMHVRVSDGIVEIRPIAGTRPRGQTPEEDERNAAELLADPKERAEHVMLVDLARNDLGRIAEFGSVRVTEQMVIERYSHVMHIVSHVTANVQREHDAFDVMRATFPAGTVSGAPKVRAMQIISDLEKSKRGCYAGAVGYFGFDGALDSCIVLRSVVLKNGRAYFQAGAGIVADSKPAAEFQESVSKARALTQALAIAEASSPGR